MQSVTIAMPRSPAATNPATNRQRRASTWPRVRSWEIRSSAGPVSTTASQPANVRLDGSSVRSSILYSCDRDAGADAEQVVEDPVDRIGHHPDRRRREVDDVALVKRDVLPL